MDPSFRDLLYGVKDVGFPIAVAAFVLMRLNGKVGENTKATQELTEEIIALRERIR